MSTVNDTTRKLEAALDRLDKALGAHGDKTAKESTVWQEALHRAESDNAAAEKRNQEIADRLDSVIGRLKSIVEA